MTDKELLASMGIRPPRILGEEVEAPGDAAHRHKFACESVGAEDLDDGYYATYIDRWTCPCGRVVVTKTRALI